MALARVRRRVFAAGVAVCMVFGENVRGDAPPEEQWVWSIIQDGNGNSVTGEKWKTAINVRPCGDNFDIHWHYLKDGVWHRYWSTWGAYNGDGDWQWITCERIESDIMHGLKPCIHYIWKCKARMVDGKVEVEGQSEEEDQDETDPDPDKKTEDPINTINGSMVRRATDVVVPTPGVFDLKFRRTYNSRLIHRSGILGPGWTHTYGWCVSPTTGVTHAGSKPVTNNYLAVETDEGRRYSLHVSDTNTPGVVRYASHNDVDWTARKEQDGTCTLFLPAGYEYRFNSNGLLTSMDSEWGGSLELSYTNEPASNLISEVRYTNGLSLEFAYTNDRLARIDSPSTNLYITFAYDSEGRLTNATRCTAGTLSAVSYAYDEAGTHALTCRVNPAGDAYRYGYEYRADGTGRIIPFCTNMVLNANAYAHTVAYYTNDHYSVVTYERDGTHLTSTNYYDPGLLRIVRVVGPCSTNLVHTYTFDERRAVCTNETVHDYGTGAWTVREREYGDDTSHNITRQGFAYCARPTNWWEYAWDSDEGLLTEIVDPEGQKISFEYEDGLLSRRKVFYTDDESYDTVHAYQQGLCTAVTNALGHYVRYAYDDYGRLAQIIPQEGPTITYSNNVLGFVEAIIRPGEDADRVTDIEVDPMGRVTSITHPLDSLEERFAYDVLGNLTNYVDTAGRSTTYLYGPAYKKTATVRTLEEGVLLTNAVSYDQQLNTLSLSDTRGRVVEAYTLDARNRPVAISNVEGQTSTVSYAVEDIVQGTVRFDGTCVTNEYDGDGRLRAVHYPDTTNVFTYLRNGLPRTIRNEAGAVTNTYDRAGRLVSSSGAGPASLVAYGHFPDGRVSNVTSVAGECVYSNDAAERVAAIQSPAGRFVYDYDPYHGLVGTVLFSNAGVTVTYDYDAMDRVTDITWRDEADNVLRSFAYDYNAAGMITNVLRENGVNYAYAYDRLDRLLSEQQVHETDGCLRSAAYTYDTVGNRLSKLSGAVTTTCTYPYGASGNRLSCSVACTEVARPRGSLFIFDGSGTPETGPSYLMTTNFRQYNVAGCVTNMSQAEAQVALSWNSAYQLVGIETNGVTAETYGYDGLGRRVWVCSGADTNWLVYDGHHVRAEVGPGGWLRKSYTYGPGTDNLLAMTVHGEHATNRYYFLTDHLGTVHAVVDTAGSVVEAYEYDAWGNVIGVYDGSGAAMAQTAIGNRYLWQGREYCWSTGLYYFRARWYDPSSGRWLSKDPIGIHGGLNQYVFCGNNPVMYRDPTGLAWNPLSVASDAGSALILAHWNRNQHQEGRVPQTESQAIKRNWTPMKLSESVFHSQGEGMLNRKYVSPDGRYEAVYDDDGCFDDDPLNEGSYNFASPRDEPIKHVFLDVLPYYLLGNSPSDPSTISSRVNVTMQAVCLKQMGY